MYDIFIDTHFAGAHHLLNYNGSCERPHGHNWKVRVTVRARELDDCGMGIDFKLLKRIVKEVIDQLDHYDINEIAWFAEKNTTSEHIAEFIWLEVEKRLPEGRCRLHTVTVKETDTQGLHYYGPQR